LRVRVRDKRRLTLLRRLGAGHREGATDNDVYL